MKTNLVRLLLLSAFVLVAGLPTALAQRELGTKKSPTSKIYVAESKGESQIQTGEKIYAGSQATAFDAPGTVIVTGPGGSNAIVYSNGTGMFVDENTRVQIDQFAQEPFIPDSSATAENPIEPSASRSDVFVARGAVALCTSQLVAGSSMLYSTPQAAVNVRGGKVAIATNEEETIVDLLEGDVTVRAGGNDIGGQILRAGERAVVRAATATTPATITVGPIPRDELAVADERTSIACNARKTVTFEALSTTADGGTEGSGEIVAKPTVPAEPPINIVISPDRLPGT